MAPYTAPFSVRVYINRIPFIYGFRIYMNGMPIVYGSSICIRTVYIYERKPFTDRIRSVYRSYIHTELNTKTIYERYMVNIPHERYTVPYTASYTVPYIARTKSVYRYTVRIPFAYVSYTVCIRFVYRFVYGAFFTGFGLATNGAVR